MENLIARTEIYDAWANIVLADNHLAQGRYREADAAILDAERHFRTAQSAITIEKSGSTLDRLADLRIKMNQIRSAASRKASGSQI